MKLVRDRCVLRHVSRVSLLSVFSYQADDTLYFPADKNFVQLQSVPPRIVRLKVPRCLSV